MFYFQVIFLISSTLNFLDLPRVGGNLLLRVLEDIEPHWELFIVSDTDIVDVMEEPGVQTKFLYSSSNIEALKDNPEDVQEKIRYLFQKTTADVAIIVCMNLEQTSFQTVEQIGIVFQGLRELRRVWTVVIWPEVMGSMEDIKRIGDKPIYRKSIHNFVVNSRLYFTFNLSSKVEAEAVTYEGYRAGDFYAFRWLPEGVIQWNCRACEGFSMRRFNFHQRILRVTAVNDTELNDDIHVHKAPNGTVWYSKDGFSGSLLIILQQLLNFTIEPTLSEEFGQLIPGTSKWTGSIGEIAEGVFDLAMSITILRPDRASMVSFLPPVDDHQIHAFFKPPDENHIRDIFAQPFKPSLWAAVVTTWLVLASCMVLFSSIRKRYGMDKDEELNEDDEREEPDFTKDSFIWALGTACQQGWDEHPKAASLRAIFISGSFTGLVAYAGYSAAIVSTLSLRIDPIQTPLQLLNSHLRVGIRKGFISTLLEQNGTKDTMSHFYSKVSRTPRSGQYLNVSSGLERLLKKPYAFITTRDTMYDLLKMTRDEKAICGVKDLPILRYPFPLGYPMPKFSPFREILRYAFTMIREPGVLYRLKSKYAYKRRCTEGSNNAGYALGANDVFTAFMVLCGGMVLSLIFIVIERMIPLQKFSYIR